ncbi:acetyl-CoA carboxylase biotin carboxylase subunit family protein [Streptomyces roseolus]|uniref:acetyl-CoA carboxylase biotin carboxylase subunit family protein n=1 Tax=Streptomyces roseolus TaxID=67358 RepID=UPI0037BC060F
MAQREKPRLTIVGSGGQAYREYSFQSLVTAYELTAVLPAEPTWQAPYLTDYRVVDCTDPEAIAAAVTELTQAGGSTGVFTWDELVLEATARAAEALGLPHTSVAAVTRCRDKYATRSLMREAGLPSPRYRLTSSADEAAAAAAEFGYPVVVKPRSLAGSIGVVKAEDESAVRAAFDLATGAAYATLPAGEGILVEEFLDGPEISVDSVVFEGNVRCVHVARKRVGFPPYFEEVGHLVTADAAGALPPEVAELIESAHRTLEVDFGVTHAEVRLTADGPRLIELNARLGGDLIPLISRMATGIDLVKAAAEIALGRSPELGTEGREPGGTAEIRFVYPPYDCTVREVDLGNVQGLPGVAYTTALAGPGTRLLLPPKNPIPRLAALVAVAADEAATTRILDLAEEKVITDVTPLTP